jgi:hypothetical protein
MTHKFVASKIITELQHSLKSLEIDIEKYEEIHQENIKLKRDLDDKINQYNIMEQEMKNQREELNNMSKVSMIQSITKQLYEKNNYIKTLESQLDKFKTKKSELIEVKSKISCDVVFDPESFEEINGYELLVYKKNYYLRDLETDELYSIIDNKPNNKVGLINNKGKVQLH